MVCALVAAPPRHTWAALSLALARSDYPRGAVIAVYPATDDEADYLLSSAHRSSFHRLRRIDGDGWIQAAIWSFSTGKGAATRRHRTTFGYAINVFHNAQQARRALADARIPRRPYRVGRIAGWLYQNGDGLQSLTYLFVAYRNIEVETYYEYRGTAPVKLAHQLRHVFNRQSSHLVHLAREYHGQMQLPAPATPAPSPSPTATRVVPTPSPTAVQTGTPVAAPSTPTPSATSTPAATPTATAVPIATDVVAVAGTTRPSYPPNGSATVEVHVTADGSALPGAHVSANFAFPGFATGCTAVTNSNGDASCFVQVPEEPDGTQVPITIQVIGPRGEPASATTSFTVHR
ncbi:MAG: hypothetical protein ACR2JC_16460 [Chloroflexota bacterium]